MVIIPNRYGQPLDVAEQMVEDRQSDLHLLMEIARETGNWTAVNVAKAVRAEKQIIGKNDLRIRHQPRGARIAGSDK